MRRRCYISPSSYLELIKTFKTLLDDKRLELLTLRNRYLLGVEKLEYASEQVVVMQQELTELQPELIHTSSETEILIRKIEEETSEVAAKKMVNFSPIYVTHICIYFDMIDIFLTGCAVR